MALSNIAGVGGGGVAVPILMGFFHFGMKPAISASSFAITITTLARFAINFTKKHPEKPNVALLNYNIATIMMPTTLAGAQIGAIIMLMCPSLIIQILLTLTLAALTLQTYSKAQQISGIEDEKEKMRKVTDSQLEEISPSEALMSGRLENEGFYKLDEIENKD